MSATRTPITREAFVSPNHVQVALRGANYPHAPALMSVVTDGGELQDIPVPQEFVQRGVLPPGYAVDFLFDPEEVVAKLTNAGATHMEEVPPQVFQKMADLVNAPGNLKIVPQWLYDQKRNLTSNALAQGITPEAHMQQLRETRDQGEGSGSGERKEKKKGFLKGLFGKK
ncbi:hypothetical protein H1R20_g1393, partial [Candolleomyces eurysporus]